MTFVDPLTFLLLAAIAGGCLLVLGVEGVALARAGGAARWWRRWPVCLALCAALVAAGVVAATWLAYRYFRDSPSYTANGGNVATATLALQVSGVLTSILWALYATSLMVVLVGLVSLARAARRRLRAGVSRGAHVG